MESIWMRCFFFIAISINQKLIVFRREREVMIENHSDPILRIISYLIVDEEDEWLVATWVNVVE